jgi:hypothetical protein
MINKESYIRKAANWAQSRGFMDIRANTEGYEKPITYDRQQDGQTFVPDVTGKQFGLKSYFEVITHTKEIDRLISKLKLLGQLAAVRGGQLYLMVPKGQLPFAKTMVANSLVAAQVVNLR